MTIIQSLDKEHKMKLDTLLCSLAHAKCPQKEPDETKCVKCIKEFIDVYYDLDIHYGIEIRIFGR